MTRVEEVFASPAEGSLQASFQGDHRLSGQGVVSMCLPPVGYHPLVRWATDGGVARTLPKQLR